MDDLVKRLREEAVVHQYPTATLIINGKETICDGGQIVQLRNPDGTEAAEAITTLQRQLADARAERDALVAVAGDAYYVLTYIEALSNDDATKAACAEVRTKIDAIKEQTP